MLLINSNSHLVTLLRDQSHFYVETFPLSKSSKDDIKEKVENVTIT